MVLTMLPSGKHVLDAYRGVGGPGLLSVAPPDTLFLDCSTINVDEARKLRPWPSPQDTEAWTRRCPEAWWGQKPGR